MHGLHRPDHLGRLAVGELLAALRLAEVVDLAVGVDDLRDRRRLVAPAAVGDRREGVRHLQRRDAAREAADRLGGVGVEMRRDAHVVGRLADLLGPDVGAELREDGVVGRRQRAREARSLPA